MSCILRVSGKNLVIDDVLPLIRLTPSIVWRVGEPRVAPKGIDRPAHQDSGLTVVVSDKDMDDLPGQIDDAITFIRDNEASLTVLMKHLGIESMDLDFAVALPRRPEVTISLPSELIAESAKHGISLTISQYEASN